MPGRGTFVPGYTFKLQKPVHFGRGEICIDDFTLPSSHTAYKQMICQSNPLPVPAVSRPRPWQSSTSHWSHGGYFCAWGCCFLLPAWQSTMAVAQSSRRSCPHLAQTSRSSLMPTQATTPTKVRRSLRRGSNQDFRTHPPRDPVLKEKCVWTKWEVGEGRGRIRTCGRVLLGRTFCANMCHSIRFAPTL